MKPRNRQISHLAEVKSKSSGIRQTIYGNRQIASLVEDAAKGPNRKIIVKRSFLIVNSVAIDPSKLGSKTRPKIDRRNPRIGRQPAKEKRDR